MRKFLVSASLLLCAATVLAAPPPPPPANIDFSDDFTSGSLSPSKWNDVREFEVSGNKLARRDATDTVLSRADLKHNNIGKSNTPRDLKFTASGLDLGADAKHLRTVTLRVKRVKGIGGVLGEVIYGTAQAYRDAAGDMKVRYILGRPGETPQEKFTDQTNGDLVLILDGSQAKLTFGSGAEATLTISGEDPNPVDLCRVEMEADLHLVGSPSIDSVVAKSDKTQW